MVTKVLHAHVPKTAGTSLNSWLDDSVSFDRAKPGNFDGLLDRWFREHGIVSDRSLHANCLSCWDLFDVLHGHRNMIPERPPGSIILTILRNPIKRTISQHYDLASLTKEHLTHITNTSVLAFHHDCLKINFADIRAKWGDKDEFRTRYVDYMCRIFLSRNVRARAFLNMEPKDRFKGAVKIIEDYSIQVGFTEYIEKSVHIFSKVLGLYPIHSLPKYNPGRPARTEMSFADIDHIRAVTLGDQMLYEYFLKALNRPAYRTLLRTSNAIT